MLKVELSRFRVKKGKEQVVDEWLDFLNNDIDAKVVMIPKKIRESME